MAVSSQVRETKAGKSWVRARGVQLRRERGLRRWAGHGLRGASVARRSEGANGGSEVGWRDQERGTTTMGHVRVGGAN